MKKVSGVPLSLRLFPPWLQAISISLSALALVLRSASQRSSRSAPDFPRSPLSPIPSAIAKRRASTYVSRSLSIRFSPTCAWKTMTMLSLLVGKMFWRLSSLHSSLLACREGCRFPSICTLLLVSLSFQRMPKRKWTRWMKNGR